MATSGLYVIPDGRFLLGMTVNGLACLEHFHSGPLLEALLRQIEYVEVVWVLVSERTVDYDDECIFLARATFVDVDEMADVLI